MNNQYLLSLVIFVFAFKFYQFQSTCPVQQSHLLNDPQRCKCGIKIDGHIYIYCARKQLKQLPKFTKSSILYDELILSGNQINTIQANSFTGLKVKRLLLDDNPLEIIEPNSFIELANYLEELIISLNQETLNRPKLSSILFQNLLNLKIIRLNGLDLDSDNLLRENIFNRTRKLEIIHLIDSGISKIDLNSLNGIETSLKELNLDNNQLSSTNEIFNEIKRMKRLQILNLSRNRIRQLARYNLGSNEIALNDLQLDLSFNGITIIDEYAFGVTSFDSASTGLVNSITKLNLNNNELNQFQLGFISQLTSLKELYLDYNKIDFLPDNLFINSRRLETLSFKGNFIQFLKSEFVFSGLHFNLKRMNLASNKIRTISKRVFMQTNKLKELNLEKNILGYHFDEVISKSQFGSNSNMNELLNSFEGIEAELKYLNLENNYLKPEHLWSLVNLLNLETLKIGNNDFKKLILKSVLPTEDENLKFHKIFEFYRNLSYLDIQNSSLKQIPYFIGLNRTLVTLNLAQNNLCNINGLNLKKFYFKLKFLNLNLNPLKCDCNMIKLRQWIDDLSLNTISSSVNFNNSSDSFNHQILKWKCLFPDSNRNKYLNELNLNDLTCSDNLIEQQCELDEDEYILRQMYSTTTTTQTTTSTITTTTHSTTTKALPLTKTTTKDEIRIIESNPSTNFRPTTIEILKETKENLGLYLLNNNNILQRQQILSHSQSQSFFSSIELKQTLLGSFIGALSVILVVLLLVCLIKTTRNKLLGKDLSLCGSENEKDKSTTTNTTNASSSPYELGKLSLQTLCINSTGCSASTASTSSGSSSSGSQHTNTSCVCGLINQTTNANDLIHLEKQCLFTKMDPMRLTMLNRSSIHQNYLNTNQLLNHIQNNSNNLHYLASSLPYQSPTQSETTSPTPYELNEFNSENKLISNNKDKMFSFFNSNSNNNGTMNNSSLLNETNTYDKLHHQQKLLSNANSSSSLRQGILAKVGINTLGPNQIQAHHFPNHLITSTLSFHNQHMIQNSSKLGDFINAAETTPFLIITNPNLNLPLNNDMIKRDILSSTLKNQTIIDNSNQHTYHEIGDVLMNLNNNNGNMRTFNRNMNINNSQNCNEFNSESKSSEMYI